MYQSAGRGSRIGGGDGGTLPLEQGGTHAGVGSGTGDGNTDVDHRRGGGNTGVRGRGSYRNEIIRTKPANIQSKQGNLMLCRRGKKFNNYFFRHNWRTHSIVM